MKASATLISETVKGVQVSISNTQSDQANKNVWETEDQNALPKLMIQDQSFDHRQDAEILNIQLNETNSQCPALQSSQEFHVRSQRSM